MHLRDIPGHQSLKEELRIMHEEERIPHAMMWVGPSGNGALAIAMAYAQLLQCEEPSGMDACGTCPSCRKAGKLQHPDIHLTYPVARIKKANTSADFAREWREAFLENPFLELNDWLRTLDAENKQANISKDDCMYIIHQLGMKTYESLYKLVIIWLPEYLRKEGNRLLKILEEPPENTHFILVAENEDEILNTIRSRCQILRVPGFEDADIVTYLTGREEISDEQAKRLAYLANGNMNAALRLAAKQTNDNASLFLEWMRMCYAGDGAVLTEWVEKQAQSGRETQKHFIQFALHYMRELLCYHVRGADSLRLPDRELQSAIKLAGLLSPAQIERTHELLNEMYMALERNAHVKILFMDASIRLHKIFTNQPEKVLVT